MVGRERRAVTGELEAQLGTGTFLSEDLRQVRLVARAHVLNDDVGRPRILAAFSEHLLQCAQAPCGTADPDYESGNTNVSLVG